MFNKKLFILCIITAFSFGCATTPKTESTGGIKNPDKQSVSAIVVSELKSSDETGAYVAGVQKQLSNGKVIPTVPDNIATKIKRDPDSLDWLSDFSKNLGSKLTDVDLLIVSIPRHSEQTYTVLGGIYTKKTPAIKSEAYLIDVEAKKVRASTEHYGTYRESTGLASITNAGNAATKTLLKK